MIELENKTTLDIDEDFLNSILSLLSKKEVELIITSKDEIQDINLKHRDIDKTTDVLSFPYEDMPMSPLGSIVISSWHVEQKALEFGHTIKDELSLLFIHGLLHLLGYDHERDNGEMREKEKELIQRFNLPDSLIVRTQG